MESQSATLVEVPTKRVVWRIVLTAVTATVVLIALFVGGYALYHDKTSEISQLKGQRQALQSTTATLSGDLATTRIKLRRQNGKLTSALKSLTRAKKNLTKMRQDVVAANERAVANYSAGYGAGNSEGYSSGRSAGLYEGSDELTCSDDFSVGWLPACNF
jgi:peptidoglycan hydrolase CwlO-like protein